MPRPDPIRLVLGALLLVAAPAAAQQADPAPKGPPAEPKLIFEREVFPYPAAGRRDPFAPLSITADDGPRFEALALRGILFSRDPARSVALVVDGAGRIHRARRGDVIGNARVLEIGPRRVTFAVDNFGIVRQEMLELQKKHVEGASSS